MARKRKIFRKKTQCAQAAGAAIFDLLQKMGGSPAKSRLAALWQNWDAIMGSDLANLARPAGAAGGILFLSAENSAEMQELAFCADDIRERANAFLGSEYFSNARPKLAQKRAIRKGRQAGAARQAGNLQKRPSGKYLAQMDSNSAVARCYALFAGKKPGQI